jgi:hypothetical protein
LHNLRDLCRVDPAAVIDGAVHRQITTVQPRLVLVDGQPMLTTELDAAGA